MTDILNSFSKNLAKIRKEKGITQEQLAEMINYSTNHISKLELAGTNPSFELLIKISKALNIDIKDLFDFDIEPSPEEQREQLHKCIDNTTNKKLKLFYKIYKSIDNV